jgi:predicted Zn-dependent peptidase
VPAIDPPLPTLDKPVFETMFDRIASPRIYRNWVVPGLNDPDYADLNVAMTVLGGLSSSRLDNILVRDEQLAVAVSAYTLPFTHGSIVQIQADAKPGISVKALEARLDQLVRWFIDTGPTVDEVQRVATRQAASIIDGLEQVGGFGGKAVALAEGELYSDNPAHYKTELERLAAATPDSVRAAMQKWLTRPVVGITVLPGERPAYDDASGQVAGGATLSRAGPARYLDDAETEAAGRSSVDRSAGLPPVGLVPNVDFPDVETISLSNGVPVYFAFRDAVPMASVLLSFDAGLASDRADKPGLHNFTLAMLEQGTTSLTAAQIAESEERLGANIFTSSDNDRTSVGVRALTANLDASLDLLADIVKNPAFAQSDIDRVRAQTLTAIDAEANDPGTVSLNTIMQEIYGAAHPYGRSATGSGTAQAVSAITREDLSAYHNGWIRPEKLAIYAIGKVDRDTLVTQLEARFGGWRGNGEAAPAKPFDAALPEQQGRVVVLHRPNSPQSFIRAAQVLPQSGKEDLLHLEVANDILGGNFLSRINLDLRETKGWSYGARSSLGRNANNVAWVVRAPVQTNQTGPSVAAIQQQMRDFLGDKGVTTDELEGTRSGNIRKLPGQFETSNAVLGQMQADILYGRPGNYAETLADRYRAMSAADLNAAMAAAVDPGMLTWVIVGDADQIRGQLDALGMPVEYRDYAAAISDVSKASESGSTAE